MADPIRWGILGTGNIARQFAQGLSYLPDTYLHAVGSRNAARSEDFAREFSVRRSYERYEDVVADEDVDVVYIATPHHRHKEDCLLCLENGKPVLCEKPFSVNASEAQQVVDCARKNDLFCMEAMWMRFMPLIQRTKQMVEAGEIGELLMLTADFSIPAPAGTDNRFFNRELGGGALLDRGVYCLSLATMLMGDPVNVVSEASLGDTGVDEQAAVILRFPEKRLAVFTTGLRTYGPIEACVYGTKGKIELHELFFRPERISVTHYGPPPEGQSQGGTSSGLKGKLVQIAKQSRFVRGMREQAKKLLGRGPRVINESLSGNGFNYEAAEVVRCLRAGEKESPTMPLDETLRIMHTMDTIRQQWGLKYPGE